MYRKLVKQVFARTNHYATLKLCWQKFMCNEIKKFTRSVIYFHGGRNMRTKKFNVICLLVSILGWILYISTAIRSSVWAIIISAFAVGLGVVGEIFIKTKRDKENIQDLAKIDIKSVIHYVLTFITVAVALYSFSVFTNDSYGYFYFGSRSYGSEVDFWGISEIIPSFTIALGRMIFPILLVIFAIYFKTMLFGIAGFMSWIYILDINTSKVFGTYKIVAAAGNDSSREYIVYNYANTVVQAIIILAVAMLILSLIHFIILGKKSKVHIYILLGSLICGSFASFMGYNAYKEGKTYDIEKHKTEIYVETKEGSERFQQENFYNSYGSYSTKCAYSGCDRMIVNRGDSNCCAVHSNRCYNCNQYIDGDAMYCMDCIKDALK